uniref:B30.2/SPRY domain-containing protein n=1 Tax=Sphaeramia orbicularis TaxID=375764 RepID=A0A673BJX3_9TELE
MDQSEDREEGAPPWKTTHRPPTGPGPGPSCVSMKTDDSMHRGIEFKRRRVPQTQPGPGPGPSCVSVKSDDSMEKWIHFKRGHVCDPHVHRPGPGPEPSFLSMKSDDSMGRGIHFKTGRVPQTQVEQQSSEVPSGLQDQTQLDSIFKLLEENICTFVKNKLKKFHQVLSPDYPECLESLSDEDEEHTRSSEAFLRITLNFLRRMKQEELAERLHSRSQSGLQRELKRNLQQKFECVFEGIAKAGNPKTLLNQIYTELYITEGGATEVNQDHEVRQIETASRNPHRPQTTITCEDIFKTPPNRDQPIRLVLTKGVAGIGKTVLTQKFSLDWAEDKANQDIDFIFPFTFRELNVLKQKFSLVELVHHFFTETKEAGIWIFEDLRVVFILDGLDECRPPLDFNNTQILTDVTESTSVDVLLMNLIRGNLLPSARLWITTRSAAANQIPAQCVDMVTEVRGFTDPQKEEYFRKRFKDEEKTKTIISHIKTSRSIHIMCHIPVFCWITATVLEALLKTTERRRLPKTLTDMYIHFLVVQAKVKNIKYDGRSGTDPHWSPQTMKIIVLLGKLAFEQLKKGNLIFYESDLRECGLDIRSASVCSGVFTEVFREETGLHQDKRFCFIHLSVQEFLAALHVHRTFINTGVNLLSEEQTTPQRSGSAEAQFYQTAVDQALESPNGHLDLFLRFLLGLSLPTNHGLLQGLMRKTGSSSKTKKETVEYIKEKMNKKLSVEKSINLFHCLNELGDRSLVDWIQQYLRGGDINPYDLSPAHWSALVFMLLSSDKDLDEFDLNKYSNTEEVLLILLPVVKASNKAVLTVYDLSERGCEGLSSVLRSQSSSLTHLELSNMDPKDSGLKILSDGLRSPDCKLETLRLSICDLSERSCEGLSSVLRSQSCSLTHLDLDNMDLKDSGLKILSDGLRSPDCKLETLRLSGCLITEEGCSSLVSALKSNPSHLRLLDLSYNHPGASGQELSALVEDPHWRLDTVRLEPSGVRWLRPGLRKYFCELTLDPNTVNEELQLSENNKKVEGVYEVQSYPEHQDRFEYRPQLMCSTGLTGRCYWEVQWSGEVLISVTYRGIRRKGDSEVCGFGRNDQSWSLRCYKGGYGVWHNNKYTHLRQSSSSGTVSVYVDCPAGSVSFYRVSSDKLIHIYTFKTTFTEPLLGGFGLSEPGSTVCLCVV